MFARQSWVPASAIRPVSGENYGRGAKLLAGSGLRVGELLGLTAGDVDLLRRTVRVERQRLQSGEQAPVKSKASRRTVPVGQVVIDALAAHLAARPSGGALFVDDLSEPLSYRRWKRLLRDAGERAGSSSAATGCGNSRRRR